MKRILKLIIIWLITVIILLVSGCGNKSKKVENTDLENTDLENTDLENTDLENTDLENTDLENTDLEYSNLYLGEVNKDVYVNKMFQLKLNGKAHDMYVISREELGDMKEYSDTDSIQTGKDKKNYVNDMEAFDKSGAHRYVSIKIYREIEEKGMEKYIETELQKQKKEYEGE